ncbi:MAG: PPC domain-containing protein [Planctomycetota bacterium]
MKSFFVSVLCFVVSCPVILGQDNPCGGECVVTSIAPGQPFENSFPASNCALPSGAPADAYRFSVDEPSRVRLEIRSSGFDPVLEIRNTRCQATGQGESCGADTVCVERDLPAGTYYAVISAKERVIGRREFQLGLAIRRTFFSPCLAGTISCFEEVQGRLDSSDCVEEPHQDYLEYWRFVADAPTTVNVFVTSGQIDSQLRILTSENARVASDVFHSGEPRNASVEGVDLDAGTYYIEVGGFDPNQQGDYDLVVTCGSIGPCLAGTVSCGDLVRGSLSNSDCVEEPHQDYVEYWELDVPEDLTVDVYVRSTEIDSQLRILTGDEVSLASDIFHSGGARDASVFGVDLAAGTYYIEVAGFDPNQRGDYDLEIACSSFDYCLAGRIGCNEEVRGTLGSSDCVTLPHRDQFEYWEFDVASPTTVDVFVQSKEIDSQLRIFDSSESRVASDVSHTGGPRNAEVTGVNLSPGTYYIEVSGFDPAQWGDYELSVICERSGSARQRAGDCTQDGIVDISDGICLLSFLFLGRPSQLPCASGDESDPANIALLDNDRSGSIDLTDGIYIFTYLFLGGRPPHLGEQCVEIDGCGSTCAQ